MRSHYRKGRAGSSSRVPEAATVPHLRKVLSANPALSEADIRVGESLLSELWERRHDPLGLIIRGHLYIEATLAELIEERLAEPQSFDLERRSFAIKLDLAEALGIITKAEKAPLEVLNRLRNQLAHKLDADITEHDEKRLLNSLSNEQRAEIQGGSDFVYTISYLHACLYGRLVRRTVE